MKKKGQRTFNNENVHRIKMLGLTLYPLYSPWLLDIFHQCGKVIDSSPASKSSAPRETKCHFFKNMVNYSINYYRECSNRSFCHNLPLSPKVLVALDA